jgi:hypothetical protein
VQPRVVVVVVLVVAGWALAWVEQSWRWVVLPGLLGAWLGGRDDAAVPTPVVWAAIFLATLATLDVGLGVATQEPLGARWRRVEAWWAWRTAPAEELVKDGCAQYRPAPWSATMLGDQRDARGRLVLRVDGEDPLRIGIVGDSVLHEIAARGLHQAFVEAGVAVEIVDTSLYGYATGDYRCMVDELAGDDLDLLLLGIVLNDEGHEVLARLDVGRGEHVYDVLSYVHADPWVDRATPLLVASDHPWVVARKEALVARWADSLVFDVSDVDLLRPEAEALAERLAWPEGAAVRLWSSIEAAGIPTVAWVFPLNTASPGPADALVDTWLAAARHGGLEVIDLREAFGSYDYLDLANSPDEDVVTGRSLHDLVHYGRSALVLAEDAALAVAAEVHGVTVDPAVRAALMDGATRHERGRDWVCTQQAPRRNADGVWTVAPACRGR